ncbi:MAG TPA: amino acid ABC transporter substrate-binding protein [Chloroflexota bacterium]|nr:amino acid ABC transporter substrate-binding protein [Chloroflexota bacterium]
MTKTRRGLLGASGAIGAMAGSVALAACGGAAGESGAGGGTAGSGTPVSVGATASLTGASAKQGQAQKEGYELWAERGSVLGRPVKLTILDDTSDPATGTKLYEKLIAEDKVDLVLGPTLSSVTHAASIATEKLKYAMLATGVSASDIFKRNHKYVFGVTTSPDNLFHPVIDLALKSNLRKVALINEDTPFANAAAAVTANYARQKGMQTVTQQRYAAKATDLTTQLNQMKGTAPEVVLAGSYEPEAILMARQLKELDINVKMLAFSFGGASPEFQAGATTNADYVLGPSAWEVGINTPGNKEFVEAYKKKFGHDPTAVAAAAYAGGQVLDAAAKKAGGLSNEKLREALVTLEATTILPGKFTVDDTGMQTGHTPVVVQWQGKEKVVVAPDNLATGKAKLPAPDWKAR